MSGEKQGEDVANTKTPPSRRKGRKKGAARPFPATTFEEALQLAEAIQRIAGGQKVRRLTLFEHLEKAPESGPSRQLVTNSGKYGLTTGGYKAEYIELTPDGEAATSPDGNPRSRMRARIKLAIQDIEPFSHLYERFVGNKLPTKAVLQDELAEAGVPEEYLAEAVDVFIVNAKYVGVLRPLAGAERLIAIDHALDEIPAPPVAGPPWEYGDPVEPPRRSAVVMPAVATDGEDWGTVCFYVTPIGEEESEERRHADLFFGSIVEPAIEEFQLRLIRADQIARPGMISRQIVEYVLRSRLLIADLSFSNPNVFYEICLRHVSRQPIVQLIRKADRIPFDLDKFRTIRIDTSSIYALVPQMPTYISEISGQVRQALSDADAVDNPISAYFPGMRFQLE